MTLAETISGFDSLTRVFVEHRLETVLLSGTADVLIINDTEKTGRVIDWKTTREIHDDHAEQMIAYAYLASEGFNLIQVTVELVYLRLGEIRARTFRVSELAEWMRWLTDKKQDIGEVYAPGPHCAFCRNKLECGAVDKMRRSAIDAFFPDTKKAQKELARINTPELVRTELARLYPKAEALRDLLDTYDDAIKEAINEAPLPLPDGRTVELATYQTTDLDAKRAWPIARKFVGESGLEAAAKLSWPELRKACPRDLLAEFEGQLFNNGALTKTAGTKKQVRKPKGDK